jgi:glyceraldehyde 3-phosphate dehydrogenase
MFTFALLYLKKKNKGMARIRLAINGFGRIGRITFRYLLERKMIDIVAVNDLTSPEIIAHLVKYDSVHGAFKDEISVDGDYLIVNGRRVRVLSEKNPEKLPWKELDIDLVIESTGEFTTRGKALKHIKAGAKKVIISAPAKGQSNNVKYLVLGINDHILSKDDVVISNSSCTTNCVAPLIKILDENWGLEKGFITTVHSYTKDQNLIDGRHSDLRRGRAAAHSIIPTTTGAAKAATRIFPHLKKNLGGAGIRVPVLNGSLTDLICTLKKPTSIEEINTAFKKAAEGKMKGILQYTEDCIVSSDIIGNTHSAVFDAQLTAVLGDKNKLVKVVAWYDNEAGYAARLVELVEKWMSL